MKMRGVLFTLGSFAITGAVVGNAWLQKKQFFPTVVYLTKSSPCMAVLYIQAFVFVLLLGKLMRKIFFGQLRAAETEHLIERSWYAVTDTCLAFTMFRDDFSPHFVASFTVLLFLKCFHWLAEDRVDYMERSPIISLLFKVRVVSLLGLLSILDAYFVSSSYETTITKGASVQLVFGFEYAILLTVLLTIAMKYVLHTIDLQSENPWENKAVYMLYVELVTGFVRVVLYTCFAAIMVKIHTFPLFAIRPMYLTMRQFKKAVSDIVLSRRAIRNMNTLYPDATAEELTSGDSTCIICREEMVPPQAGAQPGGRQNFTGVNKKLPCGHIFHASCLRSWFQRQQTCPTCRLDVLVNTTPTGQNAPAQQEPANPPGAVPPPPPGQNPFGMFGPAMFPGMFLPPGVQNPQPAPPPPTSPASGTSAQESAGSSTSTTTTGGLPTGTGFVMPPPPMMMPPPFMLPPPMPPPNYRGMSEEQLQTMEGIERRNIEQRLECLSNINALLDAAMIQIAQYVTVARGQGFPGFQIPPRYSNTAAGAPIPTPSCDNPATTSASSSVATTTCTSCADTKTSSVLSDSTTTADVPSTSAANAQASEAEVEPDNASELRRRRLAKLDSATKLQQQDSEPS